MSEIFMSQPKPRGSCARRRITLLTSLAAHVVFGAAAVWLVMHSVTAKEEEPTTIQAFYVAAPPAPPAATKSASTPKPAAAAEPQPSPLPTPTSTQAAAVEPPPASIAVGQSTGDVVSNVVGAVGGVNGTTWRGAA